VLRGLALAAAAVTLACAGTPGFEWQRPGATEEDLDRDRAECLAEMGPAMDQAGTGAASSRFDLCMRRLGWQRVAREGAD
jgi:hypothetical protein